MIYIRYLVSLLAWQILNPLGIWQSILQNGGQAIAVLLSRLGKSGSADEAMSLPFSGCWMVAKGGLEKSDSHSWNLIAQRYAYDFVFIGRNGGRHKSDGSKADQYYGFGRDVLAPADGTVISVRDGVRDYPRAGTGAVDVLTPDFRGNHLIIRHAEGVYGFIAHLKKGSCRVKPGDFVVRGQVIAQCGNSGHSTEPHVHFHLQDHPNFYLAVGLPISFQNVEIGPGTSPRAVKIRRGYITGRCTVRNLDPGEEPANDALKAQGRIGAAEGGLLVLLTSVLNVLGLIVWIALLYLWLVRPLLEKGMALFGRG